MENTDGVINIRQRLEEELKRRGISAQYLSEDEIEKAISDLIVEINANIDNAIKSVIELINKKYNVQKISEEDKEKITSLLLSGSSSEEIHQMSEFEIYPIEKIKRMEERLLTPILAAQFMPLDEIASRRKIQKQSIYYTMKKYKIGEKSIYEIRKEKEQEVERRLLEGQSIEEILKDRGLNVCESGVKAVQAKIEEQSKKQSKVRSEKQSELDENILKRAISKEDKKAILDLLVRGRTIEEISDIEEYKKYSLEKLTRFQANKSNQAKAMAVRLMPISEIARILGIKNVSVYTFFKNYTLDGKTIIQIREEKIKEIERRLLEGQSIEEILKDRGLNVCEYGVKAVQTKIEEQSKKQSKVRSEKQSELDENTSKRAISKEDKKEILDLLVRGRTIEEISDIEEYKKYSLEKLTRFQANRSNQAKIMAVRLMPISEIARILGIKNASVYPLLRKYTLDGKTIIQIREEKIKEVERRLLAGQSAEEILNDRELNVCAEFVSMKQLELGKKEEKQTKQRKEIRKPEKVSRKDKHAIALLFINGKTLEEIRAMEEYRRISNDALKRIQVENQMRILAARLVPMNEIIKRVGKKRITVYTNINKFDYGGKTLKDIQEQKLNEIRRRLTEGENIDSLAQDVNLNVCREVLEEEKEKLKGKKQNSQNSERKTQRKQNSSRPKEISTNQKQDAEQMSKLDIMRKKYKAKYAQETKQTQKEVKKPLTPEENEKVNKALLEMLEAVNSCDGEKASSRAMIKSILNNAESVFRKNVSLEQACRLVSIMESTKINPALQFFIPDITGKIRWIKKSTYSRLAEAVDTQMDDITDIDKLETLSKMLKSDMEKGNLHVSTIKSKLQRKIDKLRAEARLRSLREDIPDDIRKIILGIAKGELDVEAAKKIIAENAKEKVKGRKATRFTLTEEQERRQYIAQIKKALNEQGNKFPIENPGKTIEILKQLTNDSSLNILNTVIANQLSRKKFDEAQALCQEYIARSRENMEDTAYLFSMRKRIRNSKIGDLVYRTIHSDISTEDEEKFWNLLQEGLRMGNVKMSNISIGKTQDGLRTITLQDIWPDDDREIKK